jgi:DNA invertase Pin-like site-specific DNA recombinase
MTTSAISAAQYLRISTEQQQYSLQNQADAIAKYATEHNFFIVKTYSDAGKSGVRLENRPALKELLRDVMEGQTEFRCILVYDVSRWGRFQNVDESAYYEYLCKSSDNSVSGLLLKALKRSMAAE